MKTVFVCALILALAKNGFAINVCNQELSYKSTLVTPCLGNAVGVLWPNYEDFSTYYKCVDFGKPVLQSCPSNLKFTYYFQKCTDCKDFISAPDCEFLSQTTGVTCISKAPTTTPSPTKAPTTPSPTKGPTTPSPTKGPTTPSPTRPPITAPTKTTTKVPITTPPSGKPTPPSGIPTPPSGEGIPTPPIIGTPVPGIPTPPNENVTPPSIDGTPPTINN